MALLKSKLQTVLKRVGLYQRVKASAIYDVYWSIADRRRIEARSREVDFYRHVLRGLCQGGLICDIGANNGEKTDVFLRLGARVVAVEPDEYCQTVLKEKFLKYRVAQNPLVIVGKAVSDRNAVETMWIDGPGSALNTLSRKWVRVLKSDTSRFQHRSDKLEFAQHKAVQTTTLEELFREHGRPFFVKIDVEGHEPSVLRGMQHPVPYLSFEVNLPDFRPEGLECVRLLKNLSRDGKFNYTADCQLGLALKDWIDAREFLQLLTECETPSVEVFWRSLSSPMNEASL
jgi:FkbM family methyltransferase